MQDVRLSHTLNQCLQRDAMQDVCLSHTLNQRLQRDAMRDVRLSVTHFELMSTARCYARCPSVCHIL